ncbi:MAG: heavy metal-associated domain-containing protein [Planctomycetota bacterium]
MKLQYLFTLLFAALTLGVAGCATTTNANGNIAGSYLVVTPESADAIVQVAGMSCPQCSHNISLIMDRVDEIEASQIDLGDGRVLIAFTPGQSLTADQIAAIIDDAGFTPGEVTFNEKAGG